MLKLMVVLSFLSMNIFAQSVSADVELFPAGDFTAKSSELSGYMVQKDGALLLGRPLKVKTSSFKTGIDLRDEHMVKYMGGSKHPYITVSKGMGKGGKGIALVNFNGKDKKVKFEYKISGSSVNVDFKIKISDFGIDDVSYQGIGVEDEVAIKAKVPLK
jgi:hypothetical protein